jgi:hypothetical protein
MRGDFSRIRFNRGNEYTTVLELQGRPRLDSDANEQRLIDAYMSRTETIDVIGEFGAPADDPGFAITISGGEIFIGAGRYYVNGLMAENPAALSYDTQPHLLNPAPTGSNLLAELEAAGGASVLQLYLEVWQRLVTALDDPCLREPALGQADTTVRLQTVWRVVGSLIPASQAAGTTGPPEVSPCCQAMYAGGHALAGTGTMGARTGGPTSDCGCLPVPAAGYQGVENQLYRIEIHQGGDETTATFKWSRENGSVVAAATTISGPTVTVNSLGPDANLGLLSQQWVELTDDTNLFGQTPNQPGALYQVQSIQPADPSLTLSGSPSVNPKENARVRRWDQTGPSATANGIPLAAGTWITLENGIEISFTPGSYNAGDYWTIPARTATGTIDWPPCGGDRNEFQSPHATEMRRAPLACIHWIVERLPVRGAPQTAIVVRPPLRRFSIDDCRLLFSPLTDLAPPATIQAIHVETVNWVNDDYMLFYWLVENGLTIKLDQEVTGPINGANFIVTLEPVLFQNQDRAVAALDVFASEKLALDPYIRGIVILEGAISTITPPGQTGQTLTWSLKGSPQMEYLTWVEINSLIGYAARAGLFARVRVRLLGEMMFGAGAAGAIFLDGKTHGQLSQRADNSSCIALQLPSGEGAKSSDFEGWFYLLPELEILGVTSAYPSVTVLVGASGNVVGVEAGAPPAPVTLEATVRFNYQAVTPNPGGAPGPVNLSLDANSSAFASIQTPVPIGAGEQQVTAPITVFASPGAGQQVTVTITATLEGTTASQTTTFRLSGPALQ